jgi:TRAP-type C4-dicarboxylate transport system substrate-binding protein
MRPVARQGLLLCLIGVAASCAAAFGSGATPAQVSLAIVAPDDRDHLAWSAASQLQRNAQDQGLEIAVETAALTDSGKPLPDLLVIPVRSLATQVPTFQVLELPFFYPSLEVVHMHLDGILGKHLADEARKRGWEIVAWWDEGMHVFSGLKRYDRVRNLKAREFLITRPDPVAEEQFQYWKADARRIHPEDREAVLRECLIASRAATLQEIVGEQLYRVHLSISLTNHRYEGWVVVAPVERWVHLDEAIKTKLSAALHETTPWQRNDVKQREAAALVNLKKLGMTIYEVDASEREAFRKALPDWVVLLPDALDAKTRKELVRLASVGAAAVTGSAGGAAAAQPRSNPAPGADARQGDQGDH